MKKITAPNGVIKIAFCWPMRSAKVKDPPPPTYANEKKRQGEIHEAISKILQGFGVLKANAAVGDLQATKILVGLLHDYTDWLEGFSYRKLKLLRSVARAASQWPVTAGLHPLRQREIAKLLKRLGVGAHSDIIATERATWGTGKAKGQEKKMSIASIYAIAIRETILHVQRMLPHRSLVQKPIPPWALDCEKLPPLSKRSADKWLAVGWQAILQDTSGHPERHRELSQLGEYRKNHYAREQWKRAGRKNIITPPKTQNADLCSGIKERLKRALRSLAR